VLLNFIVVPVPLWLAWTTPALLWLSIALTVYSGLDYTMLAARVMRQDETIVASSIADSDPAAKTEATCQHEKAGSGANT
ncbi:MAG: CDP-diacylglycerol--glycerol-3-phosphate 3-phosphatidyltransferase, partial [Planctomycetota bacterium]